MMRASIHSTCSLPHLRRLLSASECRRFHSRVSSPHAASQRARMTASSSVRANLAVCSTWPVCGKKSRSDESSALCCVMGVHWAPRLDVATGADGALGDAGVSWFRSMSRSSSELRSRSRWPISEKPSCSRGANRSLSLFWVDG